jgi:hypothetical protein
VKLTVSSPRRLTIGVDGGRTMSAGSGTDPRRMLRASTTKMRSVCGGSSALARRSIRHCSTLSVSATAVHSRVM